MAFPNSPFPVGQEYTPRSIAKDSFPHFHLEIVLTHRKVSWDSFVMFSKYMESSSNRGLTSHWFHEPLG